LRDIGEQGIAERLHDRYLDFDRIERVIFGDPMGWDERE
jgi:hypothetical protein